MKTLHTSYTPPTPTPFSCSGHRCVEVGRVERAAAKADCRDISLLLTSHMQKHFQLNLTKYSTTHHHRHKKNNNFNLGCKDVYAYSNNIL